VGGPNDKRSGDRTPIGLAVRLSYGTLDEFVEKFAVNLSRGGLFIRTREPRPVGTRIAFELRLQTGEIALKGVGVVRWVQAESATASPPKAPGMGVQFTELDEASRALVERIVTHKETRGVAPGVLAPAPIAPRPELTPPPTRAPTPVIPAPRAATPSPGPPAITPAPAGRPGAVQADLSAPHRVEQLSAGAPRIDVGLPATPLPIGKRSRAIVGMR